MIKNVSQKFKDYLFKRSKYVIPVVEIYPRDTEDISSLSAPANAIARFSDRCFTWYNSAGEYQYLAKVKSFPKANHILDDRVNTAEIVLSNVARGESSASRFVLNNKIKGCWMVIKYIIPEIPDSPFIVWWGKCSRPGRINDTEVLLEGTQELGNYKIEIPFRTYMPQCPLTFGKTGCLGDETLIQKSIAYQQALATYGTMGCHNKTFETCTSLGNNRLFQGNRIIAQSGQFSYVAPEDTTNGKKNKKKALPALKTESWTTSNQSSSNEVVSLTFGRCQLPGHPISWADTGTSVKSLQGFCEGKITAFDFIRSRTSGINITQVTQHLGDWGNVGTQTLDSLFNGATGYNSRLAYLEVITDGSSPTQVDDAPLITAVIKGTEIPIPDLNGEYTLLDSTNNPIHIVRYLFTDYRFGRVPSSRMADDVHIREARYCDTLVEDRSQCESAVLPQNEYNSYGIGYRRYISTSRYTAYRDMWERGEITGDYPDFREPEIRWFNPEEQYIIPPRQTVLRQRFTLNGALQEKTSLLDFISKRLLPCFRGFISYNHEAKIEIKTRRPADNSYLRNAITTGEVNIPVINISKWRNDFSGYLLIGVGTPKTEVRKVIGINYLENAVPLIATTNGGLLANTVVVNDGGGYISDTATGELLRDTATSELLISSAATTSSSPGLSYVDITGTVSPGAFIILSIDSGSNQFQVSYTCEGIETIECVTRMLTAYLNANPEFNAYLTAYMTSDNSTRIWIRLESGSLVIDKPIEFNHAVVEEVMRVQMVFENCGDRDSTLSAEFDNIIDGSFTWNDDVKEDINAVTAKYTSAIDDFAVFDLQPRAAWDTIDLEGELNKKELDLKFIDNYWQAAYVAKSYAIEAIDGNLPFSWETGLPAILLELGDVVAVRHDSGDGVLNYVPVWIEKKELDISSYKVALDANLYLSSSFDDRVQPIEPFLTTTLNPDIVSITPPTIGNSGGYGGGSEPRYVPKSQDYYSEFQQSKYSVTGVDVV
jgi:hypothetical protein